MFYRLQQFVYTSIAVLFSLLSLMGIRVVHVTRLSSLEGERTFFLDSASSQGLMKSKLSFSDLHRIKGECVVIPLSTYDGGMYALRETILNEYQAKVLFVEQTREVVSYYCYTPLWQDGIFLQDKMINLHFAHSTTQCVVGTPIIFGGF